jgi:outer membrane biogenesis lipoprotein LolB
MMKQLLSTYGMVFMLLLGCAGLKDPGTIKPESASIAAMDPASIFAHLEQTNAGLTSFKGIGKIKIWKAGGLQSTRVVWAGYQTEKLRLEILGAGGRPFSSVVYDGSQFFLSLHSERRFYQKHTRRADLNRLMSMPVTVQDVLAILAGRVPLLKNATMTLENDPSGKSVALLLEKGWFKKQTGKIYLREDMKTVWNYELFQGKDTLVYRVEFLSRRPYGDYQLPDTLLFSNDLQTRIQIDVDNIWPDANLPPSVFILKPPG